MRARPNISYVGEFESDGKRLTRTGEDRVAKDADTFENFDISKPVMLVGDNAAFIKDTYFKDSPNVFTANAACVLQKAGSLCLAVSEDNSLITDADNLEVSYLQATKAEKDKAHSDIQEEVK